MGQAVWNEGPKTYTAYEALEAYRRVKIKSETTTIPPEVQYADAGESYIGTTLAPAAAGERVVVLAPNDNGTRLVEAADSFSVGAVLYGANDGKVSDSASGSAQFMAIQAAGAGGDIVEAIVYSYLTTAAGSVSLADSNGHTAETTVEGAIAEIYASIDGAKKTIPIPLGSLMLEDGTAIGKFSDGTSATPGFAQLSNKEVVLRWNNHSSHTAVAFSVPMPQELYGSAAVEVHWLAAMSGNTDTPDLVHECYFGAGDTDCAGTDDEIDGGTALTEYSASIAHGDVPDTMPATLTCIFQPKDGEATTDDVLVYAVWLEVEYAKLS